MPKFTVEVEGGTFDVDGADEDEALQAAFDELSYTIVLVDESEDDDEDESDDEEEDEDDDDEEDED